MTTLILQLRLITEERNRKVVHESEVVKGEHEMKVEVVRERERVLFHIW